MLDLAHKALLTFLEKHAYDESHPVVADLVFGAQLKKLENKKRINALKSRIRKLTARVHSTSDLKLVKLDLKESNRITSTLAHELFNLMTWNRVTTLQQASWKEYFHMLYDLLVSDYNYDHTSNIILARAVVKYHNVLKAPEPLHHKDNLFSVCSSISDLFKSLKREQANTATKLKNVKDYLLDVQKESTVTQHTLMGLKKELKELEDDNRRYVIILQWSTRV
jgi:hypothetical protein